MVHNSKEGMIPVSGCGDQTLQRRLTERKDRDVPGTNKNKKSHYKKWVQERDFTLET